MLRACLLLVAVAIVAVGVPGARAAAPVARASATCSDYATQAEAQRAADTQDADGDGIYCETLPCPCAGAAGDAGPAPTPTPTPKKAGCVRPRVVQRLGFSKTRYRHIRRHYIAAAGRGWPRILVLNRPHASSRRERLLEGYETRDGYDRDEYPPAVGRGRGKGLTRGSDPRGWKADVAYVSSAENRSHGARLGIKLRRFCNGTRFRYRFY